MSQHTAFRRVVRAWDVLGGVSALIVGLFYLVVLTIGPFFGYPVIQILAQAAGFVTFLRLTSLGLRLIVGTMSSMPEST